MYVDLSRVHSQPQEPRAKWMKEHASGWNVKSPLLNQEILFWLLAPSWNSTSKTFLLVEIRVYIHDFFPCKDFITKNYLQSWHEIRIWLAIFCYEFFLICLHITKPILLVSAVVKLMTSMLITRYTTNWARDFEKIHAFSGNCVL